MKRERAARSGKAFPSDQKATGEAEVQENQDLNDISVRRIDANRATCGEYFFRNRQVRTITSDGETWFTANELCAVLDIVNTSDALGRLEPDEKGVAITDTLGGPQTLTVVNESGL